MAMKGPGEEGQRDRLRQHIIRGKLQNMCGQQIFLIILPLLVVHLHSPLPALHAGTFCSNHFLKRLTNVAIGPSSYEGWRAEGHTHTHQLINLT